VVLFCLQDQLPMQEWRDTHLESGVGMPSPFFCMSRSTSSTTLRMPLRAPICEPASHERLGNSAQSPTCSPSSADQTTR